MIYDRHETDPRIRRLSDEASWAWFCLVSTCSRLGREVVSRDELAHALGGRTDPDAIGENVDALVAAELAVSMPGGHIKALARLDLWAFEDEAPPKHLA